MPVIYSSCTSDNFFPVWKSHPRKSTYDKGVLIKGGANSQHKRTMLTPRGVATQVTSEELEQLKADPAFMGFVERGFMSIDEKGKNTHDADEKGADMPKDKSAQDTAKTYKDMGKKPPKEGDEDK
jgi:hypothetical protein